MSDLKLFRLQSTTAQEIPGEAVELERSLQKLIEQNLEMLLGVRFLASEYSTGKKHAGRIDTLGIDENAVQQMNRNIDLFRSRQDFERAHPFV